MKETVIKSRYPGIRALGKVMTVTAVAGLLFWSGVGYLSRGYAGGVGMLIGVFIGFCKMLFFLLISELCTLAADMGENMAVLAENSRAGYGGAVAPPVPVAPDPAPVDEIESAPPGEEKKPYSGKTVKCRSCLALVEFDEDDEDSKCGKCGAELARK